MRTRTMLAAMGIALSSPAAARAELAPPPHPISAAQDRISVVVEGHGPDVILIPGLASSRDVWSGLATRLKRTHRVHLVQLAGFGGSPAVEDPGNRVAAPAAEAIAAYIGRERLRAPVERAAIAFVDGHSQAPANR
ncbi:alpha/beta fold hydrolase [Sphingosinicella sp. BN140058]|uniref:alpha/beta fold hydrolase n=1 Tax=Sphingosinicella sp. BN140058 TaxID=1892855 RepID=UPI0010137821|nr:hypothetical protein [Sphingosinicella sp. BN140058]QAY76059.1 hypothetical protein ETR14_05590 [Sphingosinicella sp. BN140058]